MKITKYMGVPQYLTAKVVTPGDHTIEEVVERDFNGEKQLVLLIVGSERDLRLSPHQVSRLARAFGDDTEHWKGKTITLSKGEKKGIDVTPGESKRNGSDAE